MLPNFFLIGAPKAGSTSLWHALRAHPDVHMPSPKEPNFFCDDNERSESWYRALFEDSEKCIAVGEASVAYSLVERNPGTPARLARRVPEARLLYIVRHPLRRIESAWLHHVRRRNPVPEGFNEAVRTFRPLLEGTLYWRNLSAYRHHFPDAQLQVVFLEDFAENQASVLRVCDRFLGVDSKARRAVPAEEETGAPRPSNTFKKNVSAEQYVDSSVKETIREHVPGWQALARCVPAGARRLLKRWTQTPLPARPTWEPATREWAVEQVRSDARALLEYAGKPAGFWTLARQ